MKIMRSNYDKMHRCPNWSGPAFKGGDGDCPGGSLSSQMYPADGRNTHPRWRFYTCYQCGTVVLPNVLRNLDPTWWAWRIEWKTRNLRYKIEQWKLDRGYYKG